MMTSEILLLAVLMAGPPTVSPALKIPRTPIWPGGHLAALPDGKTLIVAGGQTVALWDVTANRRTTSWKAHDKGIETIALARDGKTLATAGEDGHIRLWDARTGKEKAILRGHHRQVRSLAYSPDGKTLASVGDDCVKLWDVSE